MKKQIGPGADLSGRALSPQERMEKGSNLLTLGRESLQPDQIWAELARAEAGRTLTYRVDDWEAFSMVHREIPGAWTILRGGEYVLVTKKVQGRQGLEAERAQGYAGPMLDDRSGLQPAGEGPLAELVRTHDEAVRLPKGWRLRPFKTVAVLKDRLAAQAGELVALRRRARDVAAVDEGVAAKARKDLEAERLTSEKLRAALDVQTKLRVELEGRLARVIDLGTPSMAAVGRRMVRAAKGEDRGGAA